MHGQAAGDILSPMSQQERAPSHIQIFRLFPLARRAHTKSKGGCCECKRRRQKCSEEKPTCFGCSKRHLPCVYPAQTNGTTKLSKKKATVRLSALVGSPVCSRTGPKSLGYFDKDDMLLWHHFITCTALTFSAPWKTEIPVISGHHDFLMHGILATAALHLAYLHPSQKSRYLYVSAHHQDLAMGDFQLAMSDITPENCNAVFAFSTLLVVFILTSQSYDDTGLPGNTVQGVQNFATWVVFLRGCISVYLSARPCIESGPLSSLADFLRPEAPTDDTEDRGLCQLSGDLLTDFSVLQSSSEDEIETYRASIFQLRLAVAASCTVDPLLNFKAMIFAWPIRIPELFIQLLNDHRHPALIIMSHFCMLLKRCETLWFMGGRPGAMLESLRLELAPEWHRYLNIL